MGEYHRPIMVDEVVRGLCLRRGGVYLDCTLGGGGHSRAILEAEAGARLIGTDKDDEAIAEATKRLEPFSDRVSLHRTDFKNFARVLGEEGVDKLDGFVIDLGVSSHQIDDEARGFAYRKKDAPLDMRMDRRNALTAEEVVNGYSEERLVRLFREYGEEAFAAPIARKIALARGKGRIRTTGELEALVEEGIPPRYRSAACARKVFQAIRIEVNGELDGLYECIVGLLRRLRPEGRGCVLTFHSLEDRIVKQAFRDLSTDCTCPKNFPVCVCGKKREIEPVGRKPLTASEEEIAENPRSKSAKLRIARRLEA